MRRLYLRDAASGDLVDDVYVLTNKQFAAASTGKYFIKAFVSDSSAQLVARMWNATREIFNWMPDSGFVKVRGRIENYQNNLQFIIESVGPALDGSYDVADLVPHTQKDIPEMFAALRGLLGTIRNKHLLAIVNEYLADERLMHDFRRAPAAMSFHHAYLGGLLEHTLNAMHVADAVMPFYPGLNRDLVVAGIFLHDIAKTWELCYDCAFSYTDSGQLVGHIVKSAIWVEQKAAAASQALGEPIPQALIDVLQHIILAHHGTHEFGSPRLPSTPEALAVHAIENLDAKLMMSLSSTRGDPAPGSEGNWTEYMRAFSGKLYRPDVAPPHTANGDGRAAQPHTPPQQSDHRAPAPTPMRMAPAQTPPPPTPNAPKPKPVLSNPLFEATQQKKR
jgi:3'-5' exoribonuclease